MELDGTVAGIPLRFGVSGRVQATGPSRDPYLSVDVRTSIGKVALEKLAFEGAAVQIGGTATKRSADISRFDATLKGIVLAPAPGKKIAVDKLTLAGKARLDVARKTAAVNALISGIPDIAPLVLTAAARDGHSPRGRDPA